MRESKGKSVIRRFFYLDCLPQWLTSEQLSSGNFLVLLGDEPREIPLLDALGVNREHVWSIEHDLNIYRKQAEWDLGVSLHYGEMIEYLESLLHSNRRFLVLNLDIEGSYLNQLDPAMSSVLLFCWRNPKTVVATYSSIGRDASTLWEGVKSLSLFLWLAPEITKRALGSLSHRYAKAGFTKPTLMVLRDFFWMRSLLEHTLSMSTVLGINLQASAKQFIEEANAVWAMVVQEQKSILRLRDMERFLKCVDSQGSLNVGLGLSIGALHSVIYNAERPWSQRGYFVKFKVLPEVVKCRPWLEDFLRVLIESPLTFVNRAGKKMELRGFSSVAGGLEVWRGRDIYTHFQPREVQYFGETLHSMPLLEIIHPWDQQALIERVSKRRAILGCSNQKEVIDVSKKKNNKSVALIRNGVLTEDGVGLIRRLAKSGMDTQAILKVAPSVPERTVRAYVAVARRKVNGRARRKS